MNERDFSKLFRLDGRVALVAGAASGIGRAAAHGLAAAGAITVCADLNEQGAASTAAEIRDRGGNAEAAGLDITDQASVDAAVQSIQSRHQRIDVLVSTPAVNVRKPLLRYTAEEFEKVLRLNLKGSFLIAQAAGRVMSENQRGSIVLLSSIRSLVVEPGQGAYAATKAGLVQLARALAAELGGDGVRVNCIAPGVVETPLTEPIKRNPDWYNAYASKNALGRWATADEMAGPIVFLASDAAS
ncbi:MAG TPA: SDR family NAD(P)-dependent oxidoreductase, partial [Candidatus Sulfopaludibacter sp.]|nr:SDR family NAD(P)-dependent oxidoreductase [Candidatus Sulfopaludibacter sp.]